MKKLLFFIAITILAFVFGCEKKNNEIVFEGVSVAAARGAANAAYGRARVFEIQQQNPAELPELRCRHVWQHGLQREFQGLSGV